MDPHTGVLPGLKVMVDRAARWKFSWQQSPLAACPQEEKKALRTARRLVVRGRPPGRTAGRTDATRPTPRWSGRCRKIESASYGPFGPGQHSFKTDVNFQTPSYVLVAFNDRPVGLISHADGSGLLPEARPKLTAFSWEEIRVALMLDIGSN